MATCASIAEAAVAQHSNATERRIEVALMDITGLLLLNAPRCILRACEDVRSFVPGAICPFLPQTAVVKCTYATSLFLNFNAYMTEILGWRQRGCALLTPSLLISQNDTRLVPLD
jgi:hypothetical protein